MSTDITGTYQICTHRIKRDNTHYERQIGNGNVAGNLVPRVSDVEACAESCRYDSGGEDVVVTIIEYRFRHACEATFIASSDTENLKLHLPSRIAHHRQRSMPSIFKSVNHHHSAVLNWRTRYRLPLSRVLSLPQQPRKDHTTLDPSNNPQRSAVSNPTLTKKPTQHRSGEQRNDPTHPAIPLRILKDPRSQQMRIAHQVGVQTSQHDRG